MINIQKVVQEKFMKIETVFETFYNKRPDGLYQEYTKHWVVVTNSSTGKVDKHLDKTIIGRVYIEDNERNSSYGVVSFTFSDGVTRRLVALSNFQQG